LSSRRSRRNKHKQVKNDIPNGVSANDLPQINNTLSSFVSGLGYDNFGGSQLSQTDTQFKNLRYYMISNMRQLLSQMYVEHGLIQTLCDQPVDDAFRGGVKVDSDQLDEDEIEQLLESVESEGIIQIVAQAFKWNRLYGGAGVLIISGKNHEKELTELSEGNKLEFRAVDMWELFYNKQNVAGGYQNITPLPDSGETEFNYYGNRIHSSHVLILKGKEAPSFLKPRLRGWGMAEPERVVRSLNQYFKNNEVIFELLDEAKIDVYKISGFSSSMASDEATNQIKKRIQLSNETKNILGALVMDTEDEYIQKQMSFSGLGEMLTQIRMSIANDFHMPLTKLFGVSSSGFNSGEDDIENYNSMIDGEVRAKAKPIIINILKLKCQTLFGISPDDLTIEFEPLRVLSADQEETVKGQKYNRYSGMYAQGILTDKEYSELLKKHELLDMETEVIAGTREAEIPEAPASFDVPTNIISKQKTI